MVGGDDTPERSATPRHVLPWLVELASTLPSLVRSYAPGAPVNARTREQIMLAVTDVNGARYCARVHGAWREFLGPGAHDDAEQAMLDYARACAAAGEPLPVDDLVPLLPPAALRSVRATVARIELANLVENTADELFERLTGRRPLEPLSFVRDAVTVASALPLAASMFATAAAMRMATRVAPPIPDVELPDASDANLLVHLLATVAPAYLSHALVRLALVGFPRSIAVGVRSGRSAATVRIGRGALTIQNGLSSDTVLVVEGDVESLLQTATGSIVREFGSIRIRPS